MKIIMFEGTSEEFKEVAHLFGTTGESDRPNDLVPVEPAEAIREMLTRREISNGQRAVFQALSEGPVKYEKLLLKTGRDTSKMAGILGALGRRINNTPEIHAAGLPGSVEAIIKYEKKGGETYLSLELVAKQILEELGEI